MSQTSSAKEIFADAAELPRPDRDAFLQGACAGDPILLRNVRELLEIHDSAGRLLDGPELDGARPARRSDDESPGAAIGRYTLLALIGEGGFGSVFMAEQEEPVRRRVALKVLKPGMDTRAVVARFEQERQALAMMDHPNIAKVLDAGATASGRPFFVMELVTGQPITTYCDAHALPIAERLALLVQVCSAVQHAHTKGIIHRDLKPSNILVSAAEAASGANGNGAATSGHPLVRVIDFGIAKATDRRLTGKSVFTEARQLIGTPEYMSPEQAEGSLDVDTRSDVYSLGVLLYELLTGSTPFDATSLRSAAFGELQRIMRDVNPLKPSTRLGRSGEALPGVAARRRVEPARLGALVRGELDWIAMKALDKDRARRYQTADALAADLQRHLAGQAVLAAPPSRLYRLRKVVSRHRVPVAAGVLVLLSLVGGLSAAVWQARVAARERDAAARDRDEADARRRETEVVAGFQADQLRAIDPHLMAARFRDDLLESQRTILERAGVSQPEADARRAQLASLLADVNLTDVSLRALDRNIFSRALTAIDENFSAQPAVRASLLLSLGITMSELGLLDEAQAPMSRALAIRREMLGDDDPATIRALAESGALSLRRGRLAEADTILSQTLDRARRMLGEDDPLTIQLIVDLGALRRDQDRFLEAERLHTEALEHARRALGPQDPVTLRILVNLAVSQMPLGKRSQAEALFRQAYEGFLKARGPDATDTIRTLDNLANCLRLQGKMQEAEPLLRESVRKLREHDGDLHPDTLNACAALGMLLLDRAAPADLAEAEALFREALDGRRRTLGPDHRQTLEAASFLGRVWVAQGRAAQAEPLIRATLAGFEKLGAGHTPVAFMVRLDLAHCLTRLSRFAEAERLLLDTSAALGPGHGGSGASPCADDLAELYEAWDLAEPGKGYHAKAAQWRTGPSRDR